MSKIVDKHSKLGAATNMQKEHIQYMKELNQHQPPLKLGQDIQRATEKYKNLNEETSKANSSRQVIQLLLDTEGKLKQINEPAQINTIEGWISYIEYTRATVNILDKALNHTATISQIKTEGLIQGKLKAESKMRIIAIIMNHKQNRNRHIKHMREITQNKEITADKKRILLGHHIKEIRQCQEQMEKTVLTLTDETEKKLPKI